MTRLPKEIDLHVTPRVNCAAAAAYLGVSPRTVQRMILAGQLEAIDTSAPGSRRPRWGVAISDLRRRVIQCELAAERRLASAAARAEPENCSDKYDRCDRCDTRSPNPSRGPQA